LRPQTVARNQRLGLALSASSRTPSRGFDRDGIISFETGGSSQHWRCVQEPQAQSLITMISTSRQLSPARLALILCRSEFELNLGPFIPDALLLIIEVSSREGYHSAGISSFVRSATSCERLCISFRIKLGSSVNKDLENIQ
jgi:hypothetical protein